MKTWKYISAIFPSGALVKINCNNIQLSILFVSHNASCVLCWTKTNYLKQSLLSFSSSILDVLFFSGCYNEFGTSEHSLWGQLWTETLPDLSHCRHSKEKKDVKLCKFYFIENSQYHKARIFSSVVPSQQCQKPKSIK